MNSTLELDTRREPRFQTNQPVRVTLLSKSRADLYGRIANLSGRGMEIRLAQPLAGGDLVRISWDDTAVLGEVRHCREVEEQFAVGVKIEHVVYEFGWLAEQRAEWFGQPVDPQSGYRAS